MRPLVLIAILALLSCSSGTGARWLYDDDNPTRLRDSEIRMVTRRKARNDDQLDVRKLVCRDGRITGSVESPRRHLRGEAEIPLKTYAALWEQLHEEGRGLDVEPIDSTGGYYHEITYSLGTEYSTFSAQNRTNFLGLSNSNIAVRLDLANAIVRALDAVPLVAIPEEESKETPKTAPTPGEGR